MHGLQTIPQVRNGSGDDHAHRVVEIRGSHLVLNRDRRTVVARRNGREFFRFVRCFRGVAQEVAFSFTDRPYLVARTISDAIDGVQWKTCLAALCCDFRCPHAGRQTPATDRNRDLLRLSAERHPKSRAHVSRSPAISCVDGRVGGE